MSTLQHCLDTKVAAFTLTLSLVALVGGSGCANSPSPASNAQSEKTPAAMSTSARLPLRFKATADAEALKNAGLANPLYAYWQAHLDRDWKQRFAIEKFPRPVEEKFYVAYHANAWPLKSLEVLSVAIKGDEASVDLGFTWVEPEKSKDVARTQRDKWVRAEGQWRHVVSDPMLSGFQP